MLDPRAIPRRPDSAAWQEGPSILVVLVLLNLGAFVLRQLFTVPTAAPAGALSVPALQSGEWWTVFTHSFIHADWSHLLINLAMLVLAGRRVLADTGARHFLYIYLISGWVGAAASLLLHPQALLLGSSGCIMGIFGAYAALNPERCVTRCLGVWAPRLRARNLFFGLLIVSFALELVTTLFPAPWNFPMIHGVDHAAHAAGMITGWIYARHLAPLLENLYHREEFFPQGRRRLREADTAPAVAASGAATSRTRRLIPEPVFTETVPPPLSNDEFLRQAVDPVLDKLYATGMASLSEEERRILNEAANRFSRPGN